MNKKTVRKQKQQPASGVIMPLGRQNYALMLIGFAIIVLGFVLMAGGRNIDPNEFDHSMFSTRRIVLAPILVITGFVLEVYAIMKKGGRDDKEGEGTGGK